MDKIQISLIKPSEVELIWEKCVPFIEKPVQLSFTDISVDIIKQSLIDNDSMMVLIHDEVNIIAVNILRVETYPTGYRVLNIPIVGGVRAVEWFSDFLFMAQNIARKLNCSELRGMSQRKGWLRFLNSIGHDWQSVHEVISCKVISQEKLE